MVFDDLVYSSLLLLVQNDYAVTVAPHFAFIEEVLNIVSGFVGQEDYIEFIDQKLVFEHFDHFPIKILRERDDAVQNIQLI